MGRHWAGGLDTLLVWFFRGALIGQFGLDCPAQGSDDRGVVQLFKITPLRLWKSKMNLACVSAHLHRWKAACAACIMVLAITAAPVARATTIFTEEDPPFSFEGPEGTPIGYGVAVVQSIQKVMGTQDPITMVPWARAYKTILTQPNVAIVTMSRTRAREALFHWVGPIIENQWVIVAKKSAKLRMETLDDAKKIKAIGVVRDYAWADYLTARGFKTWSLWPITAKTCASSN